MKCLRCQTENPETKKFCRECGAKLLLACVRCGAENLPVDKFCGECGERMDGEAAKREENQTLHEAERKQVTVLFSDLTGYTAMAERLDPEEVREVMDGIFGQIRKVISKYDGFIEKFIGDAVMAMFGVPISHEDDPVRAIRAAREIHDLVSSMGPQFAQMGVTPFSMHTGIHSGLVVTGDIDPEKGTHGVSGDTINLAARLSSLANANEILVGPETRRQAGAYFDFEDLEPMRVKGKMEPVQFSRVISIKEKPIAVHRSLGVRADLTGRKSELAQLGEALERLKEGNGTVVCIRGDAGTGKSRLVEEFKYGLNLQGVQWLEGHAYAFSQNIPYFPLIDLLNRAWQIEESDPSEVVREKVESSIQGLIDRGQEVIPYIGSLYALGYPETEGLSPESFKSRISDAIRTILFSLVRKSPTVICLEDLHWADPSSMDLLRFVLSEFRYPALLLCLYRPPLSLFTSQQTASFGKSYVEIVLEDLSQSDTQEMLESLLKTKDVPVELRNLVRQNIEGNPFYLEEVVNSWIESKALVREDGRWALTRPVRELHVPPTIQGIISARLDRLERDTKRILQEASVIGRAFLYEILNRVTELKDHMDRSLRGLEQLDLIRTRSIQPELEYVFKHALTQEIVYNGLLKKERQVIHERIALVMEQLFRERVSEFCETLAFHFKRGRSTIKAVYYLVKAGEKSLKKCAVEESHRYYQEAFDLLTEKPDKTKEEERTLIDLLINWAFVFYYRGDFNGLVHLFSAHQNLAAALEDKSRGGMFEAWLGFALDCTGKFTDAYQFLDHALKLGEEAGDKRLIGYASAWLTWTCADMGLLEEALVHGERAKEISGSFESDQYLYFKSVGALGYVYWHKGEAGKVLEIGKRILDYGQIHSNVRSMVMGYWTSALSYVISSKFQPAIECCQKAIQLSADPFYLMLAKFMLGACHTLSGDFQSAESQLQEAVAFSQQFGSLRIGTLAQIFLGAVRTGQGRLKEGVEMIREAQRSCVENGRRAYYAQSELILGRIYMGIAEGTGPKDWVTLGKNIGFLLRNAPFAGRKAADHLQKAIEVSAEIGANWTLATASLELGLLHKAKGRLGQARECISRAIEVFEQCGLLEQAKEAKEALAALL